MHQFPTHILVRGADVCENEITLLEDPATKGLIFSGHTVEALQRRIKAFISRELAPKYNDTEQSTYEGLHTRIQ